MVGFDDPRIPPEICRDILARLPVKSVLRCRSVCKSWRSLISCPNFISQHSITNLHNNNGNRFLLYHPDSSFSSHDMDMESRENNTDYSLDRVIGRDFRIVGSCDGLVCLFERDCHSNGVCTVTFLIWNPAIRKVVELPPLTYLFVTHYASPLVGFGFDSTTGDYKVLCSLCRYVSSDENAHENACEIFDLSKGVWRRISPLLPTPRVIVCRESECYVNGAAHWSVCRYTFGMGRSILSFSMSDESFGEIWMPDCAELTRCDDGYRIEHRCVTFGGLVHVIVWKDWVGDDEELPASCSVWTMKEYGVTESWVKSSNIDLLSVQVSLNSQLCPRNFILWAKHEILMLCDPKGSHDKQGIVSYNTESRKSKRLFSVDKYDHNQWLCHHVCLYKESLVLMGGEG